jgi:hypothetical protein
LVTTTGWNDSSGFLEEERGVAGIEGGADDEYSGDELDWEAVNERG